MKENGTSDPQPLFVAGGAGFACDDDFGRASLSQTASGNDKIGSSGIQQYFDNNQNNNDSETDNSDTASDNDSDDENKDESGMENDIYCCGAGFLEGPVTGELRKGSVAPKNYKDGLIGGKGIDEDGNLTEGGFGGGGALNYKNRNDYHGGGVGYTGGGTKVDHDWYCDGGGRGSFSIDEEAQFDHVQEDYGKCKITYLD